MTGMRTTAEPTESHAAPLRAQTGSPPSPRSEPPSAPAHELARVAARRETVTACPCGGAREDEAATGTRAFYEEGDADEVATYDAAETPAPAPPFSPPIPPPPSGTCAVGSGPSYSPAGSASVTTSGGRKRATFAMAAAFTTNATKKELPSCCSVRQEMKWDGAYAKWRGGPPHKGFPSSAAADTWIEDRDKADKRYGYRSGPHSDPGDKCFDEYKTGPDRDQANGDTYCGRDSPYGPEAMTGQWKFRLKVVDTVNGNAVRATGPELTIDW